MSEWILVAAVIAAAVSGIPGLFLSKQSNAGQRLAALLNLLASVLGLWASLRALVLGPGPGLAMAMTIPAAEVSLLVDPLSAAFLLPLFLISGSSALYDLEYWKQSEHPKNGRRLRLFSGLLVAGMALLVAARNGIFFLIGWEIMALSAFFTVITEDEKAEVREAGWIYFASTHLSTLFLFAFFALYFTAAGSLSLKPLDQEKLSDGTASALFLLALGGFGLKAGLFPLHFWLPPAHANAPSHISALMSGVLIKMGVYGMMRVCWLFPSPPWWWGEALLGLGAISGVLGVLFAIGQHDLKRLLAYHSIENIGIIFMGLGLALAGRAAGQMPWVELGFAGALLHVWNHGLFKALLFLSAGSAIHAAHTREIDELGGLAKPMPLTAFCFLIGAVAICGLPPLNGFVSELFIYLGLFRAAGLSGSMRWDQAIFAIPVLALIGGLALVCFVKVYGAVFLGEPRGPHAERARESGGAMTAPMLLLASCCAFIGIFPIAIAPLLRAAARSWSPELARQATPSALEEPLSWLTFSGIALAAASASGLWLLRRRSGTAQAENLPTWDCGYAKPGPSMQYTASSFAQMMVELFKWILFPRTRAPRCESSFPAPAAFHSEVPDVILDRGLIPAFRAAAQACSWFRLLQRGKINAYLFYIFITLLILLLCK